MLDGEQGLAPSDLADALVVLTIAYFATSLTIHGSVKRLSGPRAAGIASLAWAFNPLFAFFARGGLEVAIYTFVASLTIFYYVDRFRPAPSLRGAALMGVLAGLTVLGRTDGVLLMAAIACDFVLLPHGERPGWRRGAAMGFAALLSAAVMLAPWAFWNLRTFGTVLQTSARAHGYADIGARSLLNDLSTLFWLRRGVAGWGLALAALAVVYLFARLPRTAWGSLARRLRPAGFLALYLVLFFAAIASYQWYRNWYFLAPSMGLLTLMAVCLLPAEGTLRRSGAAVFAGVWILLAGAGLTRWTTQISSTEGTRAAIMEDARWIEEHLPRDAVIGAFNAGRSGYFLPRRVVNLDGVVNNQVVDAFAARALDRYLADQGIDYVFERWDYVSFYLRRYAPGGMSCLPFVRHLRVGDLYRFEPPAPDRSQLPARAK